MSMSNLEAIEVFKQMEIQHRNGYGISLDDYTQLAKAHGVLGEMVHRIVISQV